MLAPFSFFSAWDPPVLPPYPNLARVQALLPRTGYATKQFLRWVTRRWCRPVYALRRELGLPRGRFPLFEAKHSERLVLAMFSSVLGAPQKDWAGVHPDHRLRLLRRGRGQDRALPGT